MREREFASYKPAAFYFPVVVVDSPIFECTLQSEGALLLKEVSQSEFFFTSHIPERVGCWVKVVRKSHLSVFASWARELADTLRGDLKDEEVRVIGGG